MKLTNTKAMVPARKYALMRRRIQKEQSKAKWVGFLYFIGIVLLAFIGVAASLFDSNFTSMGLIEIFDGYGTEGFRISGIQVLVVLLMDIMWIALIVNVLRALGKLRWLFKRKASRLYGFNRNAYAMEDLGKIFASSLKWIVVCTFLTFIVDWSAKLTILNVDLANLDPSTDVGMYNILQLAALVVLALAFVLHFFCGVLGGKVSLFSIRDESGNSGIVEVSRRVGSFAPFVRNALQIAAAGICLYFFCQTAGIVEFFHRLFANADMMFWDIETFFNPENIDKATHWLFETTNGNNLFIVTVLQLLTIVCLIVLIAHALGNSEYDMEGAEAPGRKVYVWFSLFTAVLSLVVYIYRDMYMNISDTNSLLMAIVMFVMFIVEICMRKLPGEPVKVDKEAEVEASQYLADKVYASVLPEREVDD